MNELKTLRGYFELYDTTRGDESHTKEEIRDIVKEEITKKLEQMMDGHVYKEDIEINRSRRKIIFKTYSSGFGIESEHYISFEGGHFNIIDGIKFKNN